MSTLTLEPPTETASKTKFSYTICPGVPTASALAAPLGLLHAEFIEEPDLDVTIKHIGFSPKIDYAYDERFWLRNAGHAPAIWKKSHGVDCYIVALAWLEGSYPVVTLPSSSIHSVADLRSKRLGILRSKDTAFDLLYAQQLKIYTTALSTAGLTLRDVELVEIWREKHSVLPGKEAKKQAWLESHRDIARRLAAGEFDAITVKFPADIAKEIGGVRELYDVKNHPDPLARVLPSVLRGVAVSGPLLRERRDLVVRALARLLQATDWAKEHPEETVDKLAEGYDVYPEILRENFEDHAGGIQIDLSPLKVAALRAQKDFLLQHGLIAKDFDFEPWVVHGPLAEAHELYREWQEAGRI
jgi:ABC-type nitrate/sulfonate/bicarbonate transport system substrate-binding protein